MSCDTKAAAPGAFPSLRPPGTAPQRFTDSRVSAVTYFLSSWLAIGVISAYDAYLVKVSRPVILSLERNPVCAMLIHWDPHRLSYFFLAKTTGTVTVLAVLLVLYCRRPRLAMPVTTGVLAFQVGLLLYLNLAT